MTKYDEKLSGVDEEQLRQQLRTERDPKVIKRLVVALEYKSDFHPLRSSRNTAGTNRLSTIGSTPSPSATPPRSATSLVAGVLLTSLTISGQTDGDARGVAVGSGSRRTSLATATYPRFIVENFDVEYSLAHIYRVMKKAGLSGLTARPIHYEADPEEQRRWRGEFKKKWLTLKAEGYRIVAVDQHTQKVATEQKPDWFPVNSHPRLPVSGVREKMTMLGAVTDDASVSSLSRGIDSTQSWRSTSFGRFNTSSGRSLQLCWITRATSQRR